MTETNERVESPVSKDALIRPLVIAAMLIGFGIWCYSDRDNYPQPEQWDVKHINQVAGYTLNHVIGPYVLLPAGVLVAVFAFVRSRKKIVADAEGIGYAGKDKVAWADISKIDASELQGKQILYLDHDGGRLKLDGYKLENFKELVAMVESKVNPGEDAAASQAPAQE